MCPCGEKCFLCHVVRVRIIDVSSMNGKDFDLDAIRVQVNYTP